MLRNDILAHQVSVDSVNTAGQNFLGTADNPELAKVIEGKLDTVNQKWENLVKKSEERQEELEKCVGEVSIKMFVDFAKSGENGLRKVLNYFNQQSVYTMETFVETIEEGKKITKYYKTPSFPPN